jgi:hypothetical protein
VARVGWCRTANTSSVVHGLRDGSPQGWRWLIATLEGLFARAAVGVLRIRQAKWQIFICGTKPGAA